ncbi:MAG: DUF2281 domain-containing protein [Gammaproteobacteria bacterium]|jgi:hypothetical protein|nr:DUF2281 domain-containing protein [Gammaproteobacteria bacterium]OYY24410.1 MAG: hypothetical protein B7Y68_03440 [Thiotrichales bacterium 35-46-9]HQR81530.1 hypothetical protein [Thiotrichales bacterium]MCL5796269.1 DUF2281 domain-containing protein [Gammaproteobacteria bacterium]HQR95224.1 hypothetical protein [Thiotrichales bacterium]
MMQITVDVLDNLAQEVIDFVDFLKVKYTQTSLQSSLLNDVVSGLVLSEYTLAKDWLNDEEDAAWAHIQHVR